MTSSKQAKQDLIDIQWFDCSDDADSLDIAEPKGVNGEALRALSQDAGAYLIFSKCLHRTL